MPLNSFLPPAVFTPDFKTLHNLYYARRGGGEGGCEAVADKKFTRQKSGKKAPSVSMTKRTLVGKSVAVLSPIRGGVIRAFFSLLRRFLRFVGRFYPKKRLFSPKNIIFVK